MAGVPAIPRATSAMVDRSGNPTRAWYVWLQALQALYNGSNAGLQAQITVIAYALGSPDGTVGNIPPQNAGGSNGKVIGYDSVTTSGMLPGLVQVGLVNDTGAPGNTAYYGTNNEGEKGWYPIPRTLPFFLADASAAYIDLTTTGALPFFLANGTESAIPLAA